MIERLNTAWSSMAQWFGTFLGMSFRERLEVVLREPGAKFGVRDTREVLLMPESAKRTSRLKGISRITPVANRRASVSSGIPRRETAGYQLHPLFRVCLQARVKRTRRLTDAGCARRMSFLRALTDMQLRLALDTPKIIFAPVGADQKTRIVERPLKRKGQSLRLLATASTTRRALESAHI